MTNIYAHLDSLEETVTCLAWDMLLDKEKELYEANWSNWKVNIQPDTVGLEFEEKTLYFMCIDDRKQFGAWFKMSYLDFYKFYDEVPGDFSKVNEAISNHIAYQLVSNMELIEFDEVELYGIE